MDNFEISPEYPRAWWTSEQPYFHKIEGYDMFREHERGCLDFAPQQYVPSSGYSSEAARSSSHYGLDSTENYSNRGWDWHQSTHMQPLCIVPQTTMQPQSQTAPIQHHLINSTGYSNRDDTTMPPPPQPRSCRASPVASTNGHLYRTFGTDRYDAQLGLDDVQHRDGILPGNESISRDHTYGPAGHLVCNYPRSDDKTTRSPTGTALSCVEPANIITQSADATIRLTAPSFFEGHNTHSTFPTPRIRQKASLPPGAPACKVCGWTSDTPRLKDRRSNVNRHIRDVHREPDFRCPQTGCMKAFARKERLLQKHLQTVHNTRPPRVQRVIGFRDGKGNKMLRRLHEAYLLGLFA